MTPAYCQPINFIKVYKFAIFLAEDKIAAPTALHEAKGVFSFAKENTPPLPRPHTLWGQKQPLALPSILLIVVPISPTKNKRLRAGHKTQHLPDDWLLEH